MISVRSLQGEPPACSSVPPTVAGQATKHAWHGIESEQCLCLKDSRDGTVTAECIQVIASHELAKEAEGKPSNSSHLQHRSNGFANICTCGFEEC